MLNSASTSNNSKKVLYKLKSYIPGRIRYRISGLLKNVAHQHTFKKFFESLNGVTHVRINPLAESIILNFSEKHLSFADIEQKLVTLIAQLTSIKCLTSAKNANTDSSQKSLKQNSPLLTASETSLNRELANSNAELVHHTNQLSLANKPKNQIIQKTLAEENILLDSSTVLSALPTHEDHSASHSDFWLSQCQEQAKTIKLLEQQLAHLFSKAAIGSNLLNKWHSHRFNSIKTENSSVSDSILLPLETLEEQKKWQQLATRQADKIAQLQQQVTEQQRLSAIADFHLHKWQRRFFSSLK